MQNPDGPVLTVPHTALRSPNVATEDAPTDSDEDQTL